MLRGEGSVPTVQMALDLTVVPIRWFETTPVQSLTHRGFEFLFFGLVPHRLFRGLVALDVDVG